MTFVFHVSLLKPWHGDQVDMSTGIPQCPSIGMKVQHDKEVEEVIADQVVRHTNKPSTHSLSSIRGHESNEYVT